MTSHEGDLGRPRERGTRRVSVTEGQLAGCSVCTETTENEDRPQVGERVVTQGLNSWRNEGVHGDCGDSSIEG